MKSTEERVRSILAKAEQRESQTKNSLQQQLVRLLPIAAALLLVLGPLLLLLNNQLREAEAPRSEGTVDMAAENYTPEEAPQPPGASSNNLLPGYRLEADPGKPERQLVFDNKDQEIFWFESASAGDLVETTNTDLQDVSGIPVEISENTDELSFQFTFGDLVYTGASSELNKTELVEMIELLIDGLRGTTDE